MYISGNNRAHKAEGERNDGNLPAKNKKAWRSNVSLRHFTWLSTLLYGKLPPFEFYSFFPNFASYKQGKIES
jgi:hypothetical protein